MIAREIVQECARMLRNRITGKVPVSETELLVDLSSELDELASLENWDWAKKYLDPAVVTVEDQRSYDLVEDFPQKFIEDTAKLNDGSNEVELEYENPEEFFKRDFESENSAKPSVYTVVTVNGRRKLYLAPLPDDEYTVQGLYKPAEWKLREMDSIPPVPNATILRHAVMRRYNPDYEVRYQMDLQRLYASAARDRKTVMTPKEEVY